MTKADIVFMNGIRFFQLLYLIVPYVDAFSV